MESLRYQSKEEEEQVILKERTVTLPKGMLERYFREITKDYVSKDEFMKRIDDVVIYFTSLIERQKTKTRIISTAIFLSGIIIVTSVALSSYFFSIDSSNIGIVFFYPAILGLIALIFLFHKTTEEER